MIERHFTWLEPDDVEIFVYSWLPDDEASVKAVVQISHGMAETAVRYERLASALTSHGYIVYANDHRGHGRTAGSVDEVGIVPSNSFHLMVDNLTALTERIRHRHPGLPVYMYAHSFGSFLAQQLMVRYPEALDGFILSGTNGKSDPLLPIGILIARLQAKLRGESHRSKLINDLSFGAYNKSFKPNRTAFDWLSRDNAEVDKYIADAYCGAVFSVGFYRDFFLQLNQIHRLSYIRRIPKELPILVLYGDQDAVGGMGKGVEELLRKYKEAGLSSVSSKLYLHARHELMNETNRDEVTRDMIAWLDEQVEGMRL